MSAILKKLGVPRNVRLFFETYYKSLPDGSLRFANGEHFGFSFHRIPLSGTFVAGDGAMLFYCFSAMEAIAFLSLNRHRYPDLNTLRFVILSSQLADIPILPFQKCTLLFGNDCLGRLGDIKTAAMIRRRTVGLRWIDNRFEIICHHTFSLRPELLSLHAFEQAAGLRLHIRTRKPAARFHTFLEQLLDAATLLLPHHIPAHP